MGPTYAGILGTLAFMTVTFRGVIHRGGIETTIINAAVCLAVFAAIGYIAGVVAERMITESTEAQIAAEMAELERTATKSAKARG